MALNSTNHRKFFVTISVKIILNKSETQKIFDRLQNKHVYFDFSVIRKQNVSKSAEKDESQHTYILKQMKFACTHFTVTDLFNFRIFYESFIF